MENRKLERKYKPKFVDTPWGKSEVIMEEQVGGEMKVLMPKERYKKLTQKRSVSIIKTKGGEK